MSADPCVRSDELLDALGHGCVGPELAAHVAQCDPCGEIRAVAGALLDERAVAMREASVPSAGTMWWRIQMRQRQEAQVRARRSLLIGQAATLAVATAMIVSLLGTDLADGVRDVLATVRLSGPVLLVLATWILVAPIAGWVAIRQK